MKKRTNPLPLHDGIRPSYLVLPHGERFYGLSLLYFLYTHFPFVGEDNWRRRLNSGSVVGADDVPLDENMPFKAGEVMYYYHEISRDSGSRTPFDEKILHVNEYLIVVGRPHLLPVTPSGRFLHETLLIRLRLRPGLRHLDVGDITPVHRLDKDTMGMMLLSHNPVVRHHYQAMFQGRAVRKAHGTPAPARTDLRYPHRISSRLMRSERFFLTQETDGEPNARTVIELSENHGDASLYCLYPQTGRKHRLHVHMTSLDIPILGDMYHPAPSDAEGDYGKPLKLLAKSIEFQDPVSGMTRRFKSMQTL